VRLVYKNANGIDGRFKNNWKVEKAKEIHIDLEVDTAACNEHPLNMQHKLNKEGSINPSGEARQKFIQWWCTMCMWRKSGGCRKAAQVC
jgi:hypothetical protein